MYTYGSVPQNTLNSCLKLQRSTTQACSSSFFLVYIVYRINSGVNYYLLAMVQSVEILLNVTRTKTNGMGEQQCALDTMDLCSVHGRPSPLLRCRPVPRGA